MDHCHYCRREIDAGARVCDDCADYERAVRIADRILRDSGVQGPLEAALGAEIMRECFRRGRDGRTDGGPPGPRPGWGVPRGRAPL